MSNHLTVKTQEGRITVICYNEKTKELKYHLFTPSDIFDIKKAVFIDSYNARYSIRYYNDQAKVAFATLRV